MVEYFIVVDKKIIPKQTRASKYVDLIAKAKTLKPEEALAIPENTEISLPAIMSIMRKLNYKVYLRTVNKKKTLYIVKL